MVATTVRRLPPALLLLVAGAIILSAAAVATLTVSNVGTTSVQLGLNTLQADSLVEVDAASEALTITSTAYSAAGTSQAAAVAMGSGSEYISAGVSAGDYMWTIDIKEKTGADATSADVYEVKVFTDTGGTVTEIGPLYFKGEDANTTSGDNITIRVSLGASSSTNLPDRINLTVTKQ